GIRCFHVTGVQTCALPICFSGQKCSACSRAIVHADVYDEIVERVVALTRETVKVGSGESGEATVCAVVDEKQYRTILNYIEIGKIGRASCRERRQVSAGGV